jgi:hypothetical protein
MINVTVAITVHSNIIIHVLYSIAIPIRRPIVEGPQMAYVRKVFLVKS